MTEYSYVATEKYTGAVRTSLISYISSFTKINVKTALYLLSRKADAYVLCFFKLWVLYGVDTY